MTENDVDDPQVSPGQLIQLVPEITSAITAVHGIDANGNWSIGAPADFIAIPLGASTSDTALEFHLRSSTGYCYVEDTTAQLRCGDPTTILNEPANFTVVSTYLA